MDLTEEQQRDLDLWLKKAERRVRSIRRLPRKQGRQCKDIPDRPVLAFLLPQTDRGQPCTWGTGYAMPSVRDAMPPATPEKLQLAKMAMMVRRGAVAGCTCGCRGDFTLTDKGRLELAAYAANGRRLLGGGAIG